MKYSVLMSVYKKDNPVFLKQALESIYDHQSRKPDEVVVVFDGPLTDELYSVLDQFRIGKEQVVFYYPQAENKGLGEALKIGSSYCTGDYIFRMDADDISHKQRFEKQIAYVEAHTDVDVLGGNIAEFNVSLDEKMRTRVCPERHEDIVKMGKRRNPMNHVTTCIKRSALEKCGGYETLLLVEDYYLWMRMIAHGCKLANFHETLVYVRVGNGFYSRRSSKIQIKSWKKLQCFMVKQGIIGKMDAVINMAYIVGFTCCPGAVRELAYNKLLRR